jgi:tRNA (cytidine/uridine-2'-O-)-methyltransferase
MAQVTDITIMYVVLVEPQIPQNTGSIARTCAATETPLSIVGEIPFEISEKTVRRAGLDYWPWVKLSRYQTITAFTDQVQPARSWYLSTHGTRNYFEVDFSADDALVFGSETKGLGKEFLSSVAPESVLTIPMSCAHVRSLNLSNAVSIVLFEALRQQHLRHSSKLS